MFKILKDSFEITPQNFFETCEYELQPGSQKARLVGVNHGDGSFFKNELIFVVRNAKVKYLPKLYNKVTMILNDEATKFFQRFDEHGSDYNFENIIKDDGTISLKVDQSLKERTLSELSIGDEIDLIIKYNHVWKVNGRWYPSMLLVNYRKVKKPTIDYFGL